MTPHQAGTCGLGLHEVKNQEDGFEDGDLVEIEAHTDVTFSGTCFAGGAICLFLGIPCDWASRPVVIQIPWSGTGSNDSGSTPHLRPHQVASDLICSFFS